jgi:hypothetical protein
MKKVLLTVLFVFCFTATAMADWSVTVNWTRSIGPNLASEVVFLDAAEKCTVSATDPTSCQFTVPDLIGQQIVIRSINTQGAYSETAPVVLSAAPAPASGVLVNITYVSP